MHTLRCCLGINNFIYIGVVFSILFCCSSVFSAQFFFYSDFPLLFHVDVTNRTLNCNKFLRIYRALLKKFIVFRVLMYPGIALAANLNLQLHVCKSVFFRLRPGICNFRPGPSQGPITRGQTERSLAANKLTIVCLTKDLHTLVYTRKLMDGCNKGPNRDYLEYHDTTIVVLSLAVAGR